MSKKFYEKMGFVYDGTSRIINLGKELQALPRIMTLGQAQSYRESEMLEFILLEIKIEK